MFNKKGDVRVEPISIFGLEIIPGILLLVLFLAILVILILWLVNLTSTDCINKSEWPQVQDILKKLDNTHSGEEDIQFYNKGCYLIGFSDSSQNQNENILRGKGVSSGTQLCLCSLDKIKCNPNKCQKLESIKIIKDRDGNQLNTNSYPEYTNLKFKKQGSTLVVDSPYSPEINLIYIHTTEYTKLDQDLIKNISVALYRKEGVIYTGIVPIITIKKTPELLPEGISKESLFFDLSLRDTTGMADATITSFSSDSKEIEQNAIKYLEINLILTPAFLTEHSIKSPSTIHFTRGNSLVTTKLNCNSEQQESEQIESNNLICKVYLEEYPKEFIIN